MLHRKLDWTDLDDVRWLLDRGAGPSAALRSSWTATTRSSRPCRGATGPGALAFWAAEPRIVERLEATQPRTVATLAGAGNAAPVALALDLGFSLSADALSVAVWRAHRDRPTPARPRGAGVGFRAVAGRARAHRGVGVDAAPLARDRRRASRRRVRSTAACAGGLIVASPSANAAGISAFGES